MKCPGCGSEIPGGIGTRCPRCGFIPAGAGVTPMEYVVRIPTALHKIEGQREPVPVIVIVLYGSGLASWAIPIGLYWYYKSTALPGSSLGWRALGVVLAILLALLATTFCWAGAFFYSRFVSSTTVEQEAPDRG